MAVFNIVEGGARLSNNLNQMYPSSISANAIGYADHQRSLNYNVTRRIDLRPQTPFGGGGKDQALANYFTTNPPSVGDKLYLVSLTPNTLLHGVSYGVNSGLAGFQFSLDLLNAGTSIAAAVNGGTATVNGAGQPAAVYVPVDTFDNAADVVVLTVTALPAGGLVVPAGTAGLNMWVSALVTDIADGNGNA